jgi:hypothetical protein
MNNVFGIAAGDNVKNELKRRGEEFAVSIRTKKK